MKKSLKAELQENLQDHLDSTFGKGHATVTLSSSRERNELARATAETAADPDSGMIAADRLRSIVERIERLEEERKALSGDIKDIFQEAKSAGFDIPAIKEILKLRKKEPSEIEEQDTLLDIYRRALGM